MFQCSAMQIRCLFLFCLILISNKFIKMELSRPTNLGSKPIPISFPIHITPKPLKFACDFKLDACRFRNQHNLAPYKRYYNNEKKLFDRNWMLFLNINSSDVQRYPGARLITPYYPSSKEYAIACLDVSFYYAGPGIKRFYIIQQDIDNKCVYMFDRSQEPEREKHLPPGPGRERGENIWHQIEIQIDITNGDPRFFLETQFNSHSNKNGIWAIGNFDITTGKCKRKPEDNYCYDSMVNKHINVAPTSTR